MAITIPSIESSKVLNQLDTYNYTASVAGIYKVSIHLDEIPPTGLSIVLKQNSTTRASLSSIPVSQSHMELQVVMNCAANDVIGCVLASSSASDQGGNSFKAILSIVQGAN